MNTKLFLLFVLCAFQSRAQIDTMEQYFYSSEYRYSMDVNLGARQQVKYTYMEGPNKGKQLSKSIVQEIEKSKSNPDIGSCTPCWLKTYNQHGLSYEGLFYTDCGVGQYVRYHSNGNIAEIGQFTPMKDNELDTNPCVKTGHWQYFNEDGEMIKEEDYINGVSQ